MGGFLLRVEDRKPNDGANNSPGANYLDSDSFPVNCRQIKGLMECKVLNDIPAISHEEIEDKSKGDAFTKGLAFLQVLWLVIQICTRKLKA